MKKTGRKTGRRAVCPPPLKKGDTIGLVAPAGPLVNRENFVAGVEMLQQKGFRVVYNENLLSGSGYLAGSDKERAADFNRLWADPAVKGLVAARGGYGSLRIADLVDMAQIRKKPKMLVGFSDLTVLLQAIYKKTGLVTFHGPVVSTLAKSDRESQAVFFKTLNGRDPSPLKPAKAAIIKDGSAAGILLGGNLATLTHLIATPYEPVWDRAILFVEDTGEPPYRLDRFLTHLASAGRLQQIKGLILGTFSDDDGRELKEAQEAVQTRAAELLAGHDIPIWGNFPAGHGSRNWTLPVGCQAEMKAGEPVLYLFRP
jgi:muramoyltetrapeptide carboxypeptidase